MSTFRAAATLALVLVTAHSLAAQDLIPAVVQPQAGGSVDLGGGLLNLVGDPARDQRYRDLRSGFVLDGFRYKSDQRRWLFSVSADRVGYRDQQYLARFVQAGRVKASFEFNEIPLFNSTVTSTPFTSPSPGVFRMDDGIQQGIQAGTLTLGSLVPSAAVFDLRSQRQIAAFRLIYTPAPDVDVKVNLTTTARKGAQQWGVGFGVSNMVEVPAPLDHRTTDLGTVLEWANSRRMVRVGYDASWFRNAIESLTVDNPMRFTDTATATSQARMALWPSSTSNAVNAAGSLKLPGRSQATAYLSVGDWKQNAALIPFTVNTAIAPIPLPRPTAEADARITAMNYNLSSRPRNFVWLNARFKRYDFDNRTPVFPVTNYVLTDSTVATSATGGTEPLGYVRDHFDADASFTPIPFTALRVGYTREEETRTHRYFEKTTDNVLRGTIDLTGNAFLSVRTIYEHSRRTGNGLDEQVLDDIGEQISLRQFDISDRDRDRVSAVIQVTPINQLGVTLSVAGGNDRRPGAEFGLSNNVNRVYAASIDAVPSDKLTFGGSYGFEDYKTVQDSRQANPGPQFDDPTRNWSTHGFERVHTANVSADVIKWVPKTDVRASFDFTRSVARYVYTVPIDTTLPAIDQLPSIFNELQHGALSATYRLRPDIALDLAYWYDRYKVDDFALGEGTLNRIVMTPSVLLLANAYRPYQSSTVRFGLTYIW